MTTFSAFYRREQQISSVRLARSSNLAGTYSNGPSNNGIGATLTVAASTLTIDSVLCVENDRILLFAQTSGFQNGIYFIASIGSTVVLERAPDFQTFDQMKPGYFVPVAAGTEFNGAVFGVVEPQVGIVGTDSIVFANVAASPDSLTLNNDGLQIYDTDASHLLTISPGSNLTADRVFTLTTGDAARTLDISAANVTVSTFGASVVDDASAAAAATTLGLGTGDNVSFLSATLPNAGLHLLDTNASHDLVISPGSDLTADRVLTLTTGDAARSITLSGNPTLADWFDQSVKVADNPAFASVTLNNSGLHVLDSNASHDLVITPGSDLTADRILTLTTGDAARTLDISAANVTVSVFGASLVDDAADLNALTTLNLRRGDSDTWGGGGTSFAFTCTGIVATDIVLVSLIASANNVAVTKCVAGAGVITVDFTADPGAGTIVNFLGIPTV